MDNRMRDISMSARSCSRTLKPQLIGTRKTPQKRNLNASSSINPGSTFRTQVLNLSYALTLLGSFLTEAVLASDELGPSLLRMNHCGPLSLCFCSAYIDRPLVDDLQEILTSPQDQFSLQQLQDIATKGELKTFCIRWKTLPQHITGAPAIIPIIVSGGQKHFICLLELHGDFAMVCDIPGKPHWIKTSTLSGELEWDGTALHIASNQHHLDKLIQHSRPVNSTAFPIIVTLALSLMAFWILKTPFSHQSCIPRIRKSS